MDCLTVRADAPVKPLFETLLRCMFSIASTFEGRRWSMTSWISGSSLSLQNIFATGERDLEFEIESGRRGCCSVWELHEVDIKKERWEKVVQGEYMTSRIGDSVLGGKDEMVIW